MIDECMINSYQVMTLKSTVDEILNNNNKAMFYGDPFDYTTKDIDEVIEYFENTEEYEKCMQLVYVKNDIITDGLTKKLIRDALI